MKPGLPIRLADILNGKSVEWERLEFKAGWNPEAVLPTLCAYANDFHNLGGGYIIIGIEEKNGQAVLPPAGLPAGRLDAIQKEILELGYRMRPAYHPLVFPCQIQGQNILVIWATGGQTRPYQCPVSLGKNNTDYAYYIRKLSSTVRARGADERELMSLPNTVPFDDRLQQRATLDDLELSLIQSFLRQVGSDLQTASAKLDFAPLCRLMNIVGGPDEAPHPLNVGLMFFNRNPRQFFPQTQIDVVQFPEGPGADVFHEKSFTGPLNVMLRDVLAYLKNAMVEEIVRKHPDRAEADRVFNVPYPALEEAVVNAVYHRSYEEREPIEVRVLPEEITICSYPGPDRSIRLEDLKTGRAVPRRYRNRRIGEFLKELDLTEGRGTGIPKILRAMRANGSSKPRFETDDDRSYFAVRLPLHPWAIAEQKRRKASLSSVTPQVTPQVEAVIRACEKPLTRAEIQNHLRMVDREHFRKAYLQPALVAGVIERTIPDKPNSRLQQYRLTDKGKTWLAANK